MKILLIIAILLGIIWVLAKVLFALTGLALHLLWIMAVICFLIWVVVKLKQK